MRSWRIWRSAALALVAAALGARAEAQSPEHYSSFINGVTFGAGHYRYIRLPSPHSSLCAQYCYQDRRCIAWTYQTPESNGDRVPFCYLHPRIYSQQAHTCCTSGIIYSRHAGPGPGPGPGRPYRGDSEQEQYSTFRDGVTLGTGNYRWIRLPSPHSSLCAQHCYEDRRCVAWTYQSPESNSDRIPYCYLHPFVASRSAHSCCTSGWIRGRGARF